MEALLDFTRPVDVRLLDQVVAVFLDPSNPAVSREGQVVRLTCEQLASYLSR